MAKIKSTSRFKKIISMILFKNKEFGAQKSEFNTKHILIAGGAVLAAFVVAVLLAPRAPNIVNDFNTKTDIKEQTGFNDTRAKFLSQTTQVTQGAFGGRAYARGSGTSMGGDNAKNSRNSPMVISRPGISGSQLAPGMKFTVRLLQSVKVADDRIPVIATVARGVYNDSGNGIDEDSRLFGEAIFQAGDTRARVEFKSIANPSGLVRQIQAMAFEIDGEPGVAGTIHSKNLRNVAGQFISRFVGAYADGSVQRDFMGTSQGGTQNGLLNAVSQTAKDQADSYAEGLKKQHELIELSAEKEFTVILTAPFTFREPGAGQ